MLIPHEHPSGSIVWTPTLGLQLASKLYCLSGKKTVLFP